MLGEDTEYDETNVEGWEMEDDDAHSATITQDKKAPAKYLDTGLLSRRTQRQRRGNGSRNGDG